MLTEREILRRVNFLFDHRKVRFMWEQRGFADAKIGAFSTLAFSPDDQFLAAGTSAGWVVLFCVSPVFAEVTKTAAHSKGVNHILFSKDSQFIITCSDDKTVVALHNDQKLSHISSYEGAIGPLIACDISTRNDKIVAGGFDTILHLWATTQSIQLTSVSAHTDVITSIQFTSDAQYVLTASLDGLARIWSLKGMVVLRTYLCKVEPIMCALLLPSESAFLALYSGSDASIVVVKADRTAEAEVDPNLGTDGDILAQFDGPLKINCPTSLCVGATEVVAASEDGTVMAWAFETQEPVWTLPVGRPGILKMALSANGALLAAGCVSDRKITLWSRNPARASGSA
jgi:WD40 repeat protein